jgi:hypothetical protein
VAAILAAVIVAGCRAEPVDESGLDDIEDSDPVEAEEPEPDPEDGPSEDEGADEPEGDASAEALDEPDGDGGLIPESAFEINDDLDLDAEAQSAILTRYASAHELRSSLLRGDDVQPSDLQGYFAPTELQKLEASAARLVDAGRAQRTDDATTEFVRVSEAGGGSAVVAHCLRYGPDSGVYDVESDELLVAPRASAQLFEWVMVILIDEGEELRWAVEDGAVIEDERCS